MEDEPGENCTTLEEELELCASLAVTADRRFPAAASRWIERYSLEAEASAENLETAAAALIALRLDPESDEAWATLLKLPLAPPSQL